jgi:hypothetical protein
VKRASLLLVLACSVAHADERRTTITIGGTLGVHQHIYEDHQYDYTYATSEPMVGPRMTVSWEHAPLAMPAQRGYRFAGTIVPELVGGAFIDDARAAAFIGAGLRAELQMSQREMGLLRVSARGAVYLAARGFVVGDERKPYGEFMLGEYLYIGSATRLGLEAGVLVGRAEMTDYGPASNVGAIVQAYLGWQP